MDHKGGERGGGRDEQEYEKAIVRAAALGNRHDREPIKPDLHRHPIIDEEFSVTGARASMKRPGKMPAKRHRAANTYIAG